MTELRSYLFIDRLQPKTLCFLAASSRGSMPRSEMSALLLDVTPALDIEFLADKVLKAVDVTPFVLQLDSRGGWLGLQGGCADEVKTAGETLLDAMGTDLTGLAKPEIVNTKIVPRVDSRYAFILNRQKSGSLCLPGESLYLLDCQPAVYALLAANEAEKAANIKIVDCRMTGSMGRLYLSGTDSEIEAAAEAAENALSR